MPDADLLQYCRSLRENPEFARWGTDAYIPLSAIAVPLGLPWEAVANQIDDAPPSEEVVRAIHRALSRADQQLVTVIGPAFSGQTSAMRRLAWQLADRPAEGAPIFVDLARYTAQPAGARRLTYVISEAVAASAAALAETIEGLLAKPTPIEQRFVFILDGLEQVQIQLRSDLIRELLGLANHKELDKQRFVLSCRREALPPELAGKAQLLLIRYLSGREVLGYLRARAGSTDQGNNRFGQILNAHLLDLAALPPLLAEILKRLESRQSSRLTRNQLLQDELEAQLAELPPQFQRGDVARQSLITLAWEISKQPDEALDLNDAFVLLGRVRRERGYSLEELYEQLCDARLLHDVDRRRTAFQRPAQRAYCAALALHQSANITSLIDNLLPQCAVLERHERWGSALISLAGMLAEPTPLERIARAGRATNNGLYMVLLARCLQALPRDVFKSLSPRLRGALLDACAGWADPAREPVAERRAQIADALGCLPDATSVRTLLRLACERIRPAINPRLDYEYTNVRLSAALGLRNLMLFRSPDHPAGSALWLGIAPETTDALKAWGMASASDEARLRQLIQQPSAPLEARMLAIIALGELATDGPDLLYLLQLIVAPPTTERADDLKALVRTAADGLTLCAAPKVATLIGAVLRQNRSIPDPSLGQIVYLAGRTRTDHPATLRWLVEQLVGHADPQIKAKALRSLAWIVGNNPKLTIGEQQLAPALLAAARQIGRGQIGGFDLPLPLSNLSLAGLSSDEPGVVYLRRTALEVLRWIPGHLNLADLVGEADSWPIELRRALTRSATLRKA